MTFKLGDYVTETKANTITVHLDSKEKLTVINNNQNLFRRATEQEVEKYLMEENNELR